jgi:hypothetical protein
MSKKKRQPISLEQIGGLGCQQNYYKADGKKI